MPIQRSSKQRSIIREALVSRCDHPTAQMLYDDLKKTHPNLSLATVYRNLNLLVETGCAKKIQGGTAEHFDGNITDHCHFTCTNCGEIYDISEDFSVSIDSLPQNFNGQIKSHSLMYFGLCEKCKNSELSED